MVKNQTFVRSLLSLGLLAGMLATSGIAEAAGKTLNATVTQIKMSSNDNDAVIFLSSGVSITPACTFTGGFAFDHTTARGKDLLQMATAALLSGKKVMAVGTGACVSTITMPYNPLGPVTPPSSVEVLDRFFLVQ